jgi:hypothetical protein
VSITLYFAAPSALARFAGGSFATALGAAAFGALSLRTEPQGSEEPFCSGMLPSDL